VVERGAVRLEPDQPPGADGDADDDYPLQPSLPATDSSSFEYGPGGADSLIRCFRWPSAWTYPLTGGYVKPMACLIIEHRLLSEPAG
jgi:hypothetical protein